MSRKSSPPRHKWRGLRALRRIDDKKEKNKEISHYFACWCGFCLLSGFTNSANIKNPIPSIKLIIPKSFIFCSFIN